MSFLVKVDERDAQSVIAALESSGIKVDRKYGVASLHNGTAILRCEGNADDARQCPGVLEVYADPRVGQANKS